MRRAPLLLLSLIVSCGDAEESSPPVAGPAPTFDLGGGEASVHVELSPFHLQVKNARNEVVLDSLSSGKGAFGPISATRHETSFKTSLVEGWDHVEGTDGPWMHGLASGSAEWTSTSAKIDLYDPSDRNTVIHLELEVRGPEVRIDTSLARNPGERNQMAASFVLPADEHFFGLGERYVTVDHRGRKYECWTEEGGISVGEKAPPGPTNPSPNGPGMTHLPVPFVISSRGYGLWLDTTYRTGFDLGAERADATRVYAEEPALHLRVLVHDDPKETIRHFTALTGRARLPAPWVFGVRHRYDHGDMVEGIPEYEAFRKKKIPMTMLDDTTHFLPIASQVGREGELAKWTTTVHALGYKAIGYYNAYVSDSDPKSKALVEYGKSHDLFVRLEPEPGETVGKPFRTFMISSGGQQVFTIDMTKPEAVRWYESLLQQALNLGYDGWMLDFGEYLPQKAHLYDGRSGWEAHNAFPIDYQRATVEYLRRVRGDDFMFFARAGYTGTQATAPVVWSGDPAASFDDAKGLPAQVRAGVNISMSGIPFWGSDVGGYACNADPPPDKDVYLRWVEFGALSPDMHDENACAQAPEGSPKKWWIWSDAETTEVFARYARLHTRLFPYLYAAAKEATERGTPIMRHPFLVNPELAETRAVDLEYWFGPSLYVAPVVRRAQTSRTTWLPPGKWFDWWTMEPIAGGAKVTRSAPLDVLPLFLRSGGIVAMLDPSIDTLAPETSPDVVGLDDVRDILDVRAAIDPVAQHGDAVLADGTTLFVAQFGSGKPVLPEGFTEAATDDELATCASCGKVDPLPGGAFRLRLTAAPSVDLTLSAGPILLHAWRMPRATRIRWDVAVVPG